MICSSDGFLKSSSFLPLELHHPPSLKYRSLGSMCPWGAQISRSATTAGKGATMTNDFRRLKRSLSILAFCIGTTIPTISQQQHCDDPTPRNNSLCSGAVASCTRSSPLTCTGGQAACGEWTAPQPICTDAGAHCVGVHAALLSTGSVLFWYTTGTANQNHNSYVLSNIASCANPNPSCTMTDVSPTSYTYDILCAGMSITTVNGTAGSVLATGGMKPGTDFGIVQSSAFFPSTNPPPGQWSTTGTVPDMNFARFYPSNVQKADGTTLVLSGTNATGTLVNTMENYSGSIYSATVPDIPTSANLYPRVKLVPTSLGGVYVMAGEGVQTYAYNPNLDFPPAWTPAGSMSLNADRRDEGVVLMSDMDKIFTAGGHTAGMQAFRALISDAQRIHPRRTV